MRKTGVLFSSIVLVFGLLTGCSTGKQESNGTETISQGSGDQKTVDYPSKRISIVIPYAAGGGGDTFYRAFARIAEKYVDEPIIVENKAGSAGALAINEMKNREADGHTILGITQSEPYAIANGDIPNTMEDIKPITSLVSGRSSVFASANGPFKTFEEFKKYGLENPGKAQMISAGTFNNNHLTAIAIMDELGIEGQYIPYKNAGEATKALISGNGDAGVANVSGAYAMVDEGTLRFLAIGGDKRMEKYPDVPLFSELGIVKTNDFTYRGFGVKPGTPQEVVDQFNQIVKQVNEDPEWIKYLETTGEEQYFKTDKEFEEIFNKSYELGKEMFAKMESKK